MSSRDNKYKSIRLAIGDPNWDLRSALAGQLRSYGFEDIVHEENLETLLTPIGAGEVDLWVCDAEIEGGDFCQTVSDIRHGRGSPNPFIVILALINSSDADLVRRVMNSGVDDVLLKPIPTKFVVDRIVNLTNQRKGFLVTADYIGPDRRQGDRDDGDEPDNLIQVPNPLEMRMSDGNVNMAEAIAEVQSHINEQKVEHHAARIKTLVDNIIPAYQSNNVDRAAMIVKKLESVAEDIAHRLETTKYAHVSELCDSMRNVVHRISMNPEEPSPKDLELMPQLSIAIERAFSVGDDELEAVRSISQSVRKRA